MHELALADLGQHLGLDENVVPASRVLSEWSGMASSPGHVGGLAVGGSR